MIVRSASGERAVALFPRDGGPTINPTTGVLGSNSDTWILTPSSFHAIAGLAVLPSLSEWGVSGPVTIERSDPRVYAGYPIPARFGPGVGTCLDGATSRTSTYTVHSPLNLHLTDAAGKRTGVLPSGQPVAEGDGGIVFRNGESVTVITGPGRFAASMIGTGKGAVTIESDTPAGTQSLRFNARKGKKATAVIADSSPIPGIRYDRKRVRPAAGVGLKLVGLPKRWVQYISQPAGDVLVTDLDGNPVPAARVSVRAVTGEEVVIATDDTGVLQGAFPGMRAGRRTITVRGDGFAPTRITILVRRR